MDKCVNCGMGKHCHHAVSPPGIGLKKMSKNPKAFLRWFCDEPGPTWSKDWNDESKQFKSAVPEVSRTKQ